MRILVVEDEKRIADFLSRGLESAGYAVDVAHDGSHAIDMVHTTEYDLSLAGAFDLLSCLNDGGVLR